VTDGEAVNSAELEAERILKEEFAKIAAGECPQGEDCPVHFRADEVYLHEESMYARLITYSGDYVVITGDNHALDDPILVLRMVLGKVTAKDLPPRWETTIIFVGEGTIGDLPDAPVEGLPTPLRYAETHDDWEGLQDTHTIIVSALESGFIDVSKPLEY